MRVKEPTDRTTEEWRLWDISFKDHGRQAQHAVMKRLNEIEKLMVVKEGGPPLKLTTSMTITSIEKAIGRSYFNDALDQWLQTNASDTRAITTFFSKK
jgi:myo-inositol catabolism protein IolC